MSDRNIPDGPSYPYSIEVWGPSHSTAESGQDTLQGIAAKLRAEADLIDPPACSVCRGFGWVCEKHTQAPWDVDNNGAVCCGGAGAPCESCNPLANAATGAGTV